ncbi:carnitine dehydratase (plasmid) [Burkholderia sp. PAMC 28687]|uniref:CoA transferase n=1 Tax=Burkholderia sp. PAMC 28687 TaxID=1795874 RepID=UPI00078283C8|nr:CoA transferase [Burkholderia sp. PAMC 28687]AMM18732.1 carnitine dehydratase [Burkholderia sp. PAMC 28687]
MPVKPGETFARQLEYNLANRATSSDFDLAAETEAVLDSVGAASSESGGRLSFYGRDPIVPSTVRFGSMAAVALAAKAVQIASIWRIRTGRSQDIGVDVRKALRRFSPFVDRQWETVNGYDGGMYSDPDNPYFATMYETRDGKWVLPTNPYPQIHLKTAMLLNVPSTPDLVARAVKQWDGEALEQAAVEAGVVMPLARPLRQILEMDVFRRGLRDMPLISVEKVSESDPKPFTSDARDPLSGIRALGLAHVIAGASIGRALALHGADVLNVWAPEDWEHNVFLYTSHVGTRSTTLRIKNAEARAKFMTLMDGADIFYSNRRAGYLERHDLTAEVLCKSFPGLIHTQVVYANAHGPWSDRVGFDVSTGVTMGLFCLEGTDDKPVPPSIKVVNDYVAGWLATVGVLQALKRRAVEGGSYKVVVSLSRVTLWLMSMGIFDKAYATEMAGSSVEHMYVPPEQFSAVTPLGLYTGVTEQVTMSETPGRYRFVLEPRGAAQPRWL